MPKPDSGMFGIKLVLPSHLDVPCFTEDADGVDGRHTLMNFCEEGRGLASAANIPIGHRALVYVTRPVSGFLWAIEFLGDLEAGRKAAVAHGISDMRFGKWNLMRPVRKLARAKDNRAVDRKVVSQRSGVQFSPNSFGHKYISSEEYERMCRAIEWNSELSV